MQVCTYLLFALVTTSITFYFMLITRFKPSTELKLSAFTKEKPTTKKRKKAASVKSSPIPEVENPLDEVEEKECPHYVGYLTTLPKGSSFPEECFGCRNVIRCMKIKPAGVIESFYFAKPEVESQ